MPVTKKGEHSTEEKSTVSCKRFSPYILLFMHGYLSSVEFALPLTALKFISEHKPVSSEHYLVTPKQGGRCCCIVFELVI